MGHGTRVIIRRPYLQPTPMRLCSRLLLLFFSSILVSSVTTPMEIRHLSQRGFWSLVVELACVGRDDIFHGETRTVSSTNCRRLWAPDGYLHEGRVRPKRFPSSSLNVVRLYLFHRSHLWSRWFISEILKFLRSEIFKIKKWRALVS